MGGSPTETADGGIASVVVLNALAGIGVLYAYGFLKNRNREIYEMHAPRGKAPAAVMRDVDASPPPSTSRSARAKQFLMAGADVMVGSVWSVVKETFHGAAHVNEEELLDVTGIEGVLYRRVLQALLLLSCVLCIWGLFVSLPANITGERHRYGVLVTTVGNVSQDSARLYIHLGLNALFSASTVYLAFWLRRQVNLFKSCRHTRSSQARLQTVMIRGLRKDFLDESRLFLHFDARYPGTVLRVHIAMRLDKMQKLVDKKKQMQRKLDHQRALVDKSKERPRKLLGPLCMRRRVDAVEYYASRLQRIDVSINTLWNAHHESCGVAFVTFASSSMAHQVIDDFKSRRDIAFHDSHLNSRAWTVTLAPEPEDLIWRNLHHGSTAQFFRTLFVLAIVFGIAFFWMGPVTFLANTNNLVQMRGIGPVFRRLFSILPIQGLVTAYLPTLFILLFEAILPDLLRFFSRTEGHHTTSEVEQSLVRKLFWFFLLNNLILPVVLLSSWAALLRFLSATSGNFAESLGFIFLTAFSAFFVCFLLQEAVLVNLWRLSRISAWFTYRGKRLAAVTEEETREARHIEEFDYVVAYAELFSVLCMVVFFGVMVPIILPAGILYYGIRLLVDSHNILRVHPRRSQASLGYLHVIPTFCWVSVLLSNFAMVGLFSVYGSQHVLGAASFLFFLWLIAFLFFKRTGRIVPRVSDDTPREEDPLLEEDLPSDVRGALEQAFEHPLLASRCPPSVPRTTAGVAM